MGSHTYVSIGGTDMHMIVGDAWLGAIPLSVFTGDDVKRSDAAAKRRLQVGNNLLAIRCKAQMGAGAFYAGPAAEFRQPGNLDGLVCGMRYA